MRAAAKILVVDDEAGMVRAVERVLGAAYEVVGSHSSPDALAIARRFDPDLVILDVRMPEIDGFELMARLKAELPGVDIIVMTGSLDDPNAIRQASVTEPALKAAGTEQRYVVCTRFDARDINGQYTGAQERIAYFYAGHLNQMVRANSGQCAGAPYRPWPELEKFCLAKKCT